ncbi:MAG: hypothetical protein EA391_00920 [Balneolaceae bacterium]|nr:MAG: hypothetical protein EA391_00920 [Balneolaceae bacterium]
MNLKNEYNSLIVTVRSAGERTEVACIRSIVSEGIGQEQIHIVKEAPFKKALEMCFTIAIESDAKWLLTLDADMILLPDTLQKFLTEAEKIPANYLQIQAKILDKIFGDSRKGGPRLYRVEHLKKALTISQSLKDHIRPESNIINRMGSEGYPSRYMSPVIALHDFEQYHRDIYRKACVHAVKHLSKLPEILEQVVRYQQADEDYRVILKGIYDSISLNMEGMIDYREYSKEAAAALSQMKINEKSDMPESIDIQKVLEIYSVEKEEVNFINVMYKDVPSNRIDGIKESLRQKGVLSTLSSYAGSFLSKLGAKVSKIGSK